MTQFTIYVLLIVFAIIFGISQSDDTDDCFYQPGQPGKKCFKENDATYTCCPPTGYRCEEGKCLSLDAPSLPDDVPVHIYIIIGAAVTIFAVVCIIIGVMYWQNRQMKKRADPFSPFSQSSNGSSRSITSVAYRARTTTSQSSTPKAPANMETSTTIKP